MTPVLIAMTSKPQAKVYSQAEINYNLFLRLQKKGRPFRQPLCNEIQYLLNHYFSVFF